MIQGDLEDNVPQGISPRQPKFTDSAFDSDATPPSPSSLVHDPVRPLRHTSVRRISRPSRDSTEGNVLMESLSTLRSSSHRDHTKSLQALYHLTSERLTNETIRANVAQQRLDETILTLRTVVEARNRALEDHARTSEELRLWKLQLENARAELDNAQEIVAGMEKERDEALADAARDRAKLRKLLLEKAISNAREDGWASGYKEGLETARRRRGSDVDAKSHSQKKLGGADSETAGNRRFGERGPVMSQPIRTSPPQRSLSRLRVSDVAQQGTAFPVSATTSVQSVPSVTRLSPPSRSHKSSKSTHPVSIRNSYASTLHPPLEIPMEGFIPKADINSFISLPPPHDLSVRFPNPGAQEISHRPSSFKSATRKEDDRHSADIQPLHIPPPRTPSAQSGVSTHISQFELVTAPHTKEYSADAVVLPLNIKRSGTSLGKGREQSPTQKIVQEWRSANPDMAGKGTPDFRPQSGLRSPSQSHSYPAEPSARPFQPSFPGKDLSRSNSSPPKISVEEPSDSESSLSTKDTQAEPGLLSPQYAKSVAPPNLNAESVDVQRGTPSAKMATTVQGNANATRTQPETPRIHTTYATAPIPPGVTYPDPRRWSPNAVPRTEPGAAPHGHSPDVGASRSPEPLDRLSLFSNDKRWSAGSAALHLAPQ